MGDGWGGEASQLNKMGMRLVVFPAILASLLLWGIIPVELPVMLLVVIVAVCGAAGGMLYLVGRGPVVAGMVLGLLMALGGFAAVYWWIQDRERVFWFEVIVAFFVGIAPSILLQFILQRVLVKRPAAEAE